MTDSTPSPRPDVIRKDAASLRGTSHLPRGGLPSFSWDAMHGALDRFSNALAALDVTRGDTAF